MSRQLYTYSLIRSLYEQGNDYIDSFWPLMIKVLPIDRSLVPMHSVQSSIEGQFGLNIPQHSLGIVSTRAARKGYITRSDKKLSLTEKGTRYLADMETDRAAERRINELIEDARKFVNSKVGLDYETEKVKSIIEVFINENLEYLEQFLNPDGSTTQPRKNFSNDYEAALLEYFTYVEQYKPLVFKTVQDVLCGSIISAIVQTKSFEDTAKRFDKTQVYLDSNYIFSLLGLRYEEENKPAQELFELMRIEGVLEFRVFDFTIDEINSLLSNYDRVQHQYSPHIKVRSLFGSLKARGWTAADVKEFIVSLESRLWEKQIALTPTDINLKTFEPQELDRRTALRKYKPDQSRGSKEQNHDLASIELIKRLRKKRATRIEKCTALFLTSDLKLAEFNYLEDGHKEQSTISEVIPDRLLTNLLWLKHPAANGAVSLSSIVAMHSRELFIDQAVWKQFYETVTKLRKEGSINDKDISILLFDGHIQEVLREIDSDDVDQVKPELIIENIEVARRRLDVIKSEASSEAEAPSVVQDAPSIENEEMAEIANELATSKQKLSDLEHKISEIQRDRNDRIIRTITNWKKRKELESERITVWWLNGICVVSVLLLVALSTILVRPILERWKDIEPIAWVLAIVVPLGLSILGLKLDPLHWRALFRERIFNRVYRRKLEVLDEIQTNFAIDVQDEGIPL